MTEPGKRSFKVRHLITAETLCGCYYCQRVFFGKEIKEWCDGEQTPLCPKCGIDSVVPFDGRIDNSVADFRKSLKKWNKESFS